MRNGGASRAEAEQFGRRAEAWCRFALRLKGYRILAVRERTPVGEIDMVVRRGGVVAVVEVKARRHGVGLDDPVSARQWGRLERAAAVFLARHGDLAGLAVRFDVMLVRPWRWPEHIPDAWRP